MIMLERSSALFPVSYSVYLLNGSDKEDTVTL
ncbi:hypothetical protein SAMN05443144_11650 [Fodinibius roseus]|uniref:Uncharacterized protein n=1 Tax=Fodinibius roseus TaxID=1194090 RepID=A0A1M5G1B9_9BACT|nr:hypothetical protein SAMN05443144_11650 [Fodinibius roseus]